MPPETSLPVTQYSIAKPFIVPDGSIEALKWLGLFLMVLAHVNKHWFNDKLPGIFEAGRLVMPLFGFVLAYNLARPGTLEKGVYPRVMKRLAIYGLVATPFFIGLGHLAAGWWPLNIMFMLWIAAAMMYLIEKGGRINGILAVLLFAFGGAFVEFWWFALTFILSAWWFCKSTSATALVLMLLAAMSLYVVNQNLWAVAVIPLIYAASLVDLKTPRFSTLFYAIYPVHFALILLGKTLWF